MLRDIHIGRLLHDRNVVDPNTTNVRDRDAIPGTCKQETPPQMLGRVSSSFMSVFSLAQVLGLLLSGRLAVWLGIRQVFLACAAALALIAALGYSRHKPAPEVTATGAAD